MKDLIKSYEHGHICFDLQEERIYIQLLWVDEDHRRKGLGTKMLKELLELADRLYLAVELNARGDISPDALIGFYSRHDFQVVDDTPWINRMWRSPR